MGNARSAPSSSSYRWALFDLDYAFRNTLTLSGEIYFNGAGASDASA